MSRTVINKNTLTYLFIIHYTLCWGNTTGLFMIKAMAQWEHLPHKHEDRNLDLKTHKKIQVNNGIIYPLIIPK